MGLVQRVLEASGIPTVALSMIPDLTRAVGAPARGHQLPDGPAPRQAARRPIPLALDQWARGIVSGPDGNLWFTEVGTSVIGRITTAGAIARFSATPLTAPFEITAGPDGNVWFTEVNGGQIGRITASGAINEFRLPSNISGPAGIVTGPDGNVWFTEGSANQIGRIRPGQAFVAVPTLSLPMLTVLALGLAWMAAYFIGRR